MKTIEEFEKIEIRVGTVVNCLPFPKAKKPAFQLWIDFGEPIGVKKSSAQITQNYIPSALVGSQVVCVVNLPPRKIADFISEVLVTGFPDENGNVVLCSPRSAVPNGVKLS
jgi:tRNA-binding protein